jgi:hypothetical protein
MGPSIFGTNWKAVTVYIDNVNEREEEINMSPTCTDQPIFRARNEPAPSIHLW